MSEHPLGSASLPLPTGRESTFVLPRTERRRAPPRSCYPPPSPYATCTWRERTRDAKGGLLHAVLCFPACNGARVFGGLYPTRPPLLYCQLERVGRHCMHQGKHGTFTMLLFRHVLVVFRCDVCGQTIAHTTREASHCEGGGAHRMDAVVPCNVVCATVGRPGGGSLSGRRSDHQELWRLRPRNP